MDWPNTCWFPADFLSLQSSKELGSFTHPVAVSSRFVLYKITPSNFSAGQNTHPTLPLHFPSAKLQTLNFPPSNLQHSNHWNPKITELLCVPKNDKLKKIQSSSRRAYLGSLPGFEVPGEGPSLRTFQDLGYLDKGISGEPSGIWGYVCVSWGQPIWRTFKDLGYLKYLEKGLSSFHFMIWSTLSILKQAHFEILPGFWGYLEHLEKAYYLENLSCNGVPTLSILRNLGDSG